MRTGATSRLASFELQVYRFLLQNFYVKNHAGNFMMSLMVEDADKWWEYIESSGLAKKYELGMAKAPQLQPRGLRVLYLSESDGRAVAHCRSTEGVRILDRAWGVSQVFLKRWTASTSD